MTKSREETIKGLMYRSNYRGCKETDILIGRFAAAKLNNLNDDQLKLFEQFVVEDDAEIYDWILNKTPSPEKYQALIEDIRQFHNL